MKDITETIQITDITEPVFSKSDFIEDAFSNDPSSGTVALLELLDSLPQSKAAAEVIGMQTPESILNKSELQVFNSIKLQSYTSDAIGAKSIVVVVKSTRLCNLRCTYCNAWREGPGNTMDFETLSVSIRNLLNIKGVNKFDFVWHGGEITMLAPSYFKKLIWLQQQFRPPGVSIGNSMQTNATMLTNDWLEFISLSKIGIGVSIDGPPSIHDKRRLDRHGSGTSQKVEQGIRQLKSIDTCFGGLIVVDKAVFNTPATELLSYFNKIGLHNIDFLNLVPDNSLPACSLGSDFINYDEFITFLCEIYEEWFSNYQDTITVRIFVDLLAVIEKREENTTNCYWSGSCSKEIFTLEADGVIAPCDKYVKDEGSRLGNISDTNLNSLLNQSNYHQAGLEEASESKTRMKKCKWFHLCQGGCPHDRLVNIKNNFKKGDDYICCGVEPLFDLMKAKYESYGPVHGIV